MIEETPQPTPTVIRTQTYTCTVEHLSDGSVNILRKNDGFNATELLGFCQMTSLEILTQLAGSIKADVITRQVIVDAPNETNK